MLTHDFYYELPEELIAQTALERRDKSRLMCLNKDSGEIEHSTFVNIINMLNPGDCLVMNRSKVIPARLFGKKKSGGRLEVFLLRDLGEGIWECLVKPGKYARPGENIVFPEGLSGVVKEILPDGIRVIDFSCEGVFLEILDKIGQTPLPPYIKTKLENPARYQTVYAKDPGSVAAPTAGLHFTEELLEKFKDKGVELAYITLHIGLGTFRPVYEENIENHKMHSEYFLIDEENAAKINKIKSKGGRIIAVGTTACRTLESAYNESGGISAETGSTDIFIYPGYEFKCIDALITNFHLPESTLIMLVSAFAGRDKILRAYNEAVKEKYRFFSFGDAMFIY